MTTANTNSTSTPYVQVNGVQTAQNTWINNTIINDSITLTDDLHTPAISAQDVYATNSITASSISAVYLYGDGSNLTGLGFENNTYQSDLNVQGKLTANSIESPIISAQSLYGDGSNLTGLGFENNTYQDDLNIQGDLTVTGSISSPVISANEIFVNDNSIHFRSGATISSTSDGSVEIGKLAIKQQDQNLFKRNLSINSSYVFEPAPDTIEDGVFQGNNGAGWYRILQSTDLIHGQLKITFKTPNRLTATEHFVSVDSSVTDINSIIIQQNCLVRNTHIQAIRTAKRQGSGRNLAVVDVYFTEGAINDLNSASVFKIEFLGALAVPINPVFEWLGNANYYDDPTNKHNLTHIINYIAGLDSQNHPFNNITSNQRSNYFWQFLYTELQRVYNLQGGISRVYNDIHDYSRVERIHIRSGTGFLSNGVIRTDAGRFGRDAGAALAVAARGGYGHGLGLTSGNNFFTAASEHFHVIWSPAPIQRPNRWGDIKSRSPEDINYDYFKKSYVTPHANFWRNLQLSNSISYSTQELFCGGITDYRNVGQLLSIDTYYAIDTQYTIDWLAETYVDDDPQRPLVNRPGGPLYQAQVRFWFNEKPNFIDTFQDFIVRFPTGIAGISAAILPGRMIDQGYAVPPNETSEKYYAIILLSGLNDVEWNPGGAGFVTQGLNYEISTSGTILQNTESLTFDVDKRNVLRVKFAQYHNLTLGLVVMLRFGPSFNFKRTWGHGERLTNCCVSKIISPTEIEITAGIKRNSDDQNIYMCERAITQWFYASKTERDTKHPWKHYFAVGGNNGFITGDKVRFRSTGLLPALVQTVDSDIIIGRLQEDVDYYVRMGYDQYWMRLYYTEDGARYADSTQQVYFHRTWTLGEESPVNYGAHTSDGIVFMRIIDRPEEIFSSLPDNGERGIDVNDQYFNRDSQGNILFYNVRVIGPWGTSGVRQPLDNTLEAGEDWVLIRGNTDPAHHQTIADVGWSMSRNIYANKYDIARGVIHRATLGGMCNVGYHNLGSTAVGFNTRTHADMAHAIGYDITNKTNYSFEAGVSNNFKFRMQSNQATFVTNDNSEVVSIDDEGNMTAKSVVLVSPDESKYKITVDNNGVLSTVLVTS